MVSELDTKRCISDDASPKDEILELDIKRCISDDVGPKDEI